MSSGDTEYSQPRGISPLSQYVRFRGEHAGHFGKRDAAGANRARWMRTFDAPSPTSVTCCSMSGSDPCGRLTFVSEADIKSFMPPCATTSLERARLWVLCDGEGREGFMGMAGAR